MIKKLALLFYTVRLLKPIQFYWRLYLKIKRFFPFSEVINEPFNIREIDLISPVIKRNCLVNKRFCFLNETRTALLPVGWNNTQANKLWLYNLHYFDYLNQADIEQLYAVDIMQDWIKYNPVGVGNGWEPYTLSLRLVNWVKFLSCTDLPRQQCHIIYCSLLLQSRFLYQHIEYHLLGNHLFKNAVALLFAGVFFNTKEAQSWLNKGLQIILQQINEQVLADGGHFERSPMYHILILEDVLDCLNLNQAIPFFTQSETGLMTAKSADMLSFLADILHQDGEIPFFNDTALLIAPSPESVFNYAERLGVEFINSTLNETVSGKFHCIAKADFGLFILKNQSVNMIFDVGEIGPDYLPGHAHCDSLSYELSLGGLRCIVNSGTYQYAGAERNTFRATKAHNTVRIDGVEQHEIWSTFRVARRGYPSHVSVTESVTDGIECTASLSEFSSDQLIHKRNISFYRDQLIIVDAINGKRRHLAESYVHLHPEVEIINHTGNVVHCQRGSVEFSIQALEESNINIEKGYFSPEFGVKVENIVLVLRKQSASPFTFGYKISY